VEDGTQLTLRRRAASRVDSMVGPDVGG
jgi:hypothetical protein